jgi:phosphate transport system ATP-binding protein
MVLIRFDDRVGMPARPEATLLDEPASALDPIGTLRVQNAIGQLRQDLTIAYVTPDMRQGARRAGRVAFFDPGEAVETGTASEIFGSPRQRRTQDYIAGHFG